MNRFTAALLSAGLMCAFAPEVLALGASCGVTSPTLNFGSYNPVSGAPATTSATITVSCTAALALSVPFTVTLSAGNSGSTANRSMSGSSASLPYNVFTNGSYTTVWDNTTGVSGSISLLGVLGLFSGSSDLTAFGRILASQAVPAGVYTDTLVITVSY